jgi:hypothetical protein
MYQYAQQGTEKYLHSSRMAFWIPSWKNPLKANSKLIAPWWLSELEIRIPEKIFASRRRSPTDFFLDQRKLGLEKREKEKGIWNKKEWSFFLFPLYSRRKY